MNNFQTIPFPPLDARFSKNNDLFSLLVAELILTPLFFICKLLAMGMVWW